MEIKDVKESKITGQEIYFFSLRGDELIKIAEIRKFNSDPEGTGRLLDYQHILEIRDFFRQGNLIPENIVGELKDWQYFADKKVLVGNDQSKLLITDGQHRVAALTLLSEEEQSQQIFEIVGTITDYSTRLKMATQQAKRKTVDPRYVLQVADLTDTFADRPTKQAYQILKQLNQEKDSPLFGSFWMTEKPTRFPKNIQAEIELHKEKLEKVKGLPSAVAFRESKTMINVVSLLGHLKSVVSSNYSVLHDKPQSEQYQILKNLFLAASRVWPEAWQKPDRYYLKRSHGIGALIKLIVLGQNFRALVKNDWRVENLKKVLSLITGFDWSFREYKSNPELKFPTVYDIALKLDNLLWQKQQKKRR